MEATGPFNKEAVDAFQRELDARIEEVRNAPWAYVASLKGDSVSIPEAEEAVVQAMRWRPNTGMVCAANVLERGRSLKLIAAQLDRLNDKAGVRQLTGRCVEDR